MVQVIGQGRLKPKSTSQQFGEAFSRLGQGVSSHLHEQMMMRDQQEQQLNRMNQENEAFKREFGGDISGITDPKVRQEIFKQAMQVKMSPEMYNAKYGAKLGALQQSGLGKYLEGGQQERQPSVDRNKVNEFGEMELGNVGVLSMIPDQAIFNAEMMGEHGLAQQFREHNKAIQEESRHREKQQEKRELHKENLDYQSYKDNKDYIEKVISGYEGYKRDRMVLDAMSNLSNKGNLPTPFLAKSLEKLGLPIGILQNPDAEQFEKLSQELMKNIQGTYGSRILQSEVQSFMRSIPTLMNSPEGQKRLIQQWNLLNEGKKIYYDAYKQVKKENPERLPRDLHEQVLERAEGALEKMSNRFRSLSQVPTDYVKSPGKVLVVDPYGEIGEIEERSLEEALKEGYEFLE